MIITALGKSRRYVDNRSWGCGDAMGDRARTSAGGGEGTRARVRARARAVVWVCESCHRDGPKALSRFVGEDLVDEFVLGVGDHSVDVDR